MISTLIKILASVNDKVVDECVMRSMNSYLKQSVTEVPTNEEEGDEPEGCDGRGSWCVTHFSSHIPNIADSNLTWDRLTFISVVVTQ